MSTRQRQRKVILPAFLLLVLFLPEHAFASLNFQTTLPTDYDLALDTRKETECKKNSLAKAVCLPPEHLIAGHNRLANFSGLFWLLGTAGLSGSEHVVVIGNESKEREFIAGWLYVAGQSRVTVVELPVFDLLKQVQEKKPGRSRGTTRDVIYTAKSRTHKLLLKAELQEHLNSANTPTIFDGRSESEYWGRSILAARGGHIPGAIHLERPSTLNAETEDRSVAYAHDTISGLAYLARLKANDVDATLYLGGWVEWAADASMPVDALSYPQRQRPRAVVNGAIQKNSVVSATSYTRRFVMFAALSAIILLVALAAFQLGRRHGLKT